MQHPPRRFASPPSLAFGGRGTAPAARQSRFRGARWQAAWRAVAVVFLASIASVAWSQSVALSGVAGGKALVVIDGASPRFLSAGQSHQGVKVVSVQGESATVEVGGEKRLLRVGEAPVSVGRGGASPGDGGQRIVLTADGQGHFMSSGLINGKTVQFMVDTGATNVILSEADAKRINLAFDKGQRVSVSTANGQVLGHMLRLQSVKVGDVQVYDVPAIVLPQTMPFVLLGNSFLTRFQMLRQNDQMTLERRY